MRFGACGGDFVCLGAQGCGCREIPHIRGGFFLCVCAVGDGGGRCAIGFDCACDHVVVCEQLHRMSTARVHVGWV